MSACPETVAQVRAAFHELLDLALDRLCGPMTGGVYSSFAEITYTEGDGRPVAGAPSMPFGLAIALGARSRAQLASSLEVLTAVAAAAGDTVRTTKRSKGADHGHGS